MRQHVRGALRLDGGALHHRPLPGLVLAVALVTAAAGIGACSGTTVPTIPGLPTAGIPTMFPDDLASGTGACIDPATMTIIDRLRAADADIPGLLAANKDALVAGLGRLESSDPATMDWRDALLTALDTGDMDEAAAQVQRLIDDEVQLTPC
jgi:hypothetical protein